eukprot:PhM_4_TR1321/c3_g2_i7/m.101106
MEGITALMYADDLTVIVDDITPRLASPLLQRACDVISSWAKGNCMQLNAEKSESILFTLSSHTAEDAYNPKLRIAGKPLRHTRMGQELTTKMLGLRLDHRLNLNNHMLELGSKTAIRVSQLGSLASVQNGAQPQTLLALHRGYVESKLLQGGALYSLPQKSRDEHNDRTALERLASVQRRSLKATAGLLPSTDDESTYLETRSLPIQELAQLRAAYLAEKYMCTRPWWSTRPPPSTPNARSHGLVPQTRNMLECIHSVSWNACMRSCASDQLKCPRLGRLPYTPWSTSRRFDITFAYLFTQ